MSIFFVWKRRNVGNFLLLVLKLLHIYPVNTDVNRSDLLFHALITTKVHVHLLFFSFGHLSFKLSAFTKYVAVLKSTQTIIPAASSQSTHARPVYPLISTRLDIIPFYCWRWSIFSKHFWFHYSSFGKILSCLFDKNILFDIRRQTLFSVCF